MKRSNHKAKVGEKPTITCQNCGHESPSKFAAKRHICGESH